MSPPERIGQYRILVLGEGGMGIVYEAEQSQPSRRVAVKVIRAEYASSSIGRRFELESEVLGRLQHPGIAQIYEAGTEHAADGSDVETIVGKALEKDKTRRYGSARDLATDIRRYLTDQPILARPASAAYQLRKFARRNRALVAGVAAAVAALAAGTVVSSLLALRARRAERLAVLRQSQAEDEAARERAVSGFLTDVLQSASPDYQQGRALTVRDVIGGAAQWSCGTGFTYSRIRI